MKKESIQKSNYLQREKNFLRTVASEDTFQVIIGNDGSDTFMLWQDEYYMEMYLKDCQIPIKLSKVNTVIFLKYMKDNLQKINFSIHPVFGEELLKISPKQLMDKIIGKIESDGDFYDTLRENYLL